MKKAILIILLASAALVVAFLWLRSAARQYWEATLDGPFRGVSYTGSVTTAPTSALAIPSRGQLEVHELQSYTNPVVVLRSSSGDIQWTRLLIPEKTWQDGTIHHAGLRDLRLQNWEHRGTSSIVFVTCHWDWGGREGGLIELDAEYGFKSFSLSW